jgi:peptide chain release factor 1
LLDHQRLREIIGQFDELTEKLCDPELLADPAAYMKATKERSGMEKLASKAREYLQVLGELDATRAELSSATDPEMQALFKEEFKALKEREEGLEAEVKILLLPPDPYAGKNVIVEIRPAAGGDESAIFAGDLFRMYCRFADSKGWKYEVLDAQPQELGGFKELTFEVTGHEVFGNLKYESGVHRVQRVPATEAQGRIHTSTVTVAVLPEADDVEEVPIRAEDLKVDTYRSSGAGGQHVNKTESAIRITHLPSGIVVACQEERSQHQNRDKAMRTLRAKLLEVERVRAEQELAASRKSQVGTGDRSEKIRTYNYPQSRVTDHRIGLSVQNLPAIMEGDLGEIIDALRHNEQQSLLQGATT